MFNINNNELSYGRGYVYSLQYHLVWCTKYRKKVLKDGIDAECKEMLCDLAEEYKFQILAMEVMPDQQGYRRGVVSGLLLFGLGSLEFIPCSMLGTF